MFKSLFVALTALTAGATAADTTQSTSTASALPAGPYCPSFPVTPEQQRAIFDKFTEHFLVTAKFHTAFSQHVASTYIQHNPFILSGRDTILKFFPKDTADPAAAGYPANIITQSVDSKTQIAMFHYYFTPAPGTQPSVTVDIFRMNGSCIEEHWDVSMDRPANAPNPLAMFTPKN